MQVNRAEAIDGQRYSRGQIIANTGEKVDGMEAQTLRGSVFIGLTRTLYANRGSGRSFIVYQD